MNAREPVIEVEGLVVRYGETTAVDAADLVVRRGEIFGFIGPNGAGKSSTMRVLATVLAPDAGRVRVLGRDVAEAPAWIRWRLGYMPDLFGMPDVLTVREYLEYAAGLHALAPDRVPAAVATVLELTDLTSHVAKPVGALSKGVRQRLFLARTLLHEPDVLILDEPASGLDPRARIELRAVLTELQAMGKTILISSHVLAELSAICDAVGIVEDGRVLLQGSVGDILARVRPHVDVRAEVLGGASAAAELVRAADDVDSVRVAGEELRFSFGGDRGALAELLARLVHAGHSVAAFDVHRGDMEDVFLTVTKGVVS